MPRFKILKEDGKYYIVKRVLWLWWRKVPDWGFGWNVRSMLAVTGSKYKDTAERILNEHYRNPKTITDGRNRQDLRNIRPTN